MIYHRTWSQWLRMRWVIGVSVKITDSDVRLFKHNSTRWWLFAYIHMLYLEQKYINQYSSCVVTVWMDWAV
jgi:hypothetical protein